MRAGLSLVRNLPRYRWTSLAWLQQAARRPTWYDPRSFLRHAGELADRPTGYARYLAYLEWLAEDEPTRKRQCFDRMSRGWAIGTENFTRALALEHRELAGRGLCLAADVRALHESEWSECLGRELDRIGRRPEELRETGKSAPWKLRLAVKLKAETTVTNRWLSTHLHLDALHEVSRKVGAWSRRQGAA